MPFKIEDGKLAKDDRDFINVASPKPVLFKALCKSVDRAEAAERERDELAAANATLEKRVRELTAERDAAQEQISAMRSAISPDRAHYIADDYAHLVGGECGYTKSLREYAKAACQP